MASGVTDTWALGLDVTVENIDSSVEEIRVKDIALSGSVQVEEVAIDIFPDNINEVELDVYFSTHSIDSSIVDAQIVPFEKILQISDISPEATSETWFAASARSAKIIHDMITSVGQRVESLESVPAVIVDTQMSDTSTNAVQNKVIKAYVDARASDTGGMFYWLDEAHTTIGTKYNLFSEKEISAGGIGTSTGESGGEGGGDVDLTGYATQEWVQEQGYALASDIPTKVSELENDENYVTKGHADGTYVIYADEFVPLKEKVDGIDERVTALEATGGGTGGEIDLSAYATKTWVTEQGYATTSAIPTKVSQLTNDRNYITTTAADGKYAAYSDLKDYLKTTDIADWAKAASKPSYTYDEISGTPDLSIYALASDLANYLTTATASDTYVSKTSLTDTLASYLLKTDIADWAKASTKPIYKYSEIEDTPDLSGVDTLLAWYNSVGNLFTLDSDGVVKMDGDFFTTGENSAGGEGESVGTTGGGLDEDALSEYLISNGYVTQTEVNDGLANKVDKVSGKGLSTNDYTTAEKNKLAGLENYDDTALVARMTTAETNIKTNADDITELDKRVDTFEEWYEKVGKHFGYDETNEAWYVAGTFYATGENSAGGAGEELIDIAGLDTRVGTLETKVNNLAVTGGPLNVDIVSIFNLGNGSIQDTDLDTLGLTLEVIENLLRGLYTKVVYEDTSGNIECWSYDGYKSSGYYFLSFRQGDGDDTMNKVTMTSADGKTWDIVTTEI